MGHLTRYIVGGISCPQFCLTTLIVADARIFRKDIAFPHFPGLRINRLSNLQELEFRTDISVRRVSKKNVSEASTFGQVRNLIEMLAV